MESRSSASKKRNISRDDDEEEEENMEKFYALIKSIREARDRLIINNPSSAENVNKSGAADDQRETKKRKLLEEEKKVVAWNPSFQREDFMGEADKLKKLPPNLTSIGSTSQSKQGGDDNDQKEEVKDELDLNLSL
ncbi:hypothetical protein E1A91_A11G118500v1 [Gossypium mustelinum]|uniref:Uncharacterized protein n=4 Tax=Gossypium TaxID=3633 RepID=A0A5J5TPM3_GOSBA|nr:hypothetical protein ES319_A11G114900v1 [Gossypium barbadense]TYG93597.1 hypothetical protein ES288_A11G122800v1 [Gossypium darwinii]TYI00260.1 hypothetical protein ES332_A11G121000v1 [Gossypium tomentosum]TYJ09107.1 hypothetical protein E1A91_A11G118500v1 [Gossypium mustelinum]